MKLLKWLDLQVTYTPKCFAAWTALSMVWGAGAVVLGYLLGRG